MGKLKVGGRCWEAGTYFLSPLPSMLPFSALPPDRWAARYTGYVVSENIKRFFTPFSCSVTVGLWYSESHADVTC